VNKAATKKKTEIDEFTPLRPRLGLEISPACLTETCSGLLYAVGGRRGQRGSCLPGCGDRSPGNAPQKPSNGGAVGGFVIFT
jgi:hypothetical protein